MGRGRNPAKAITPADLVAARARGQSIWLILRGGDIANVPAFLSGLPVPDVTATSRSDYKIEALHWSAAAK